jgi:acyl carrier protein
MSIEEEFGVTIEDEVLPTLKTVGDLVSFIDANKA